MKELTHYIEILKLLHANHLSFAVTGTFGLYLQNKTFAQNYSLKDCDIFIRYSEETLRSIILLMKNNGWHTTLWEEEINLEGLMKQAEGKYYIRCRKEHLILDATYDYEADKFGDMNKDLIYVNELPVINASKILEGKKYRGTEKDLLSIAVFKNL